MEKGKSKDRPLEPVNAPVIIESTTRDMLLLHFKAGMGARSLAEIFSLPQEAVEEKIINFSAQFSNRTYLMNVIEGLANMKSKKAKGAPGTGIRTEMEEETAALRERLKEAETRAEALEEMIRLAEASYGIPIRKKSGAK